MNFSQLNCVFFLLSLLLFASNTQASSISPGTTLVLTQPSSPIASDGSDYDCEFVLAGTCQINSLGSQFGVRTTAVFNFSRGEGKALQYYILDIDGGDGSETALLAQVSGKTIFNGFLALVGGGQVKSSLTLKIMDVGMTGTPYPGGERVVHKTVLSSHELKGVAIAGPSLSITVEGGAPYIGVGGSPGLTLTAALQKQLVRDNLEFGINVLLQRGHRYKLLFEVNTLAKKGAIRGLSIAQFMLGDDRAPDMIDPQHWLDGINNILDTKLPNIGGKRSNILELDDDGIFNFFSTERVLGGARSFTYANEILAHSGLPTSFKELVEKRITRSGILEERIANPGAEIEELVVTLQTDQVEILHEQTRLLEQIIKLQSTPLGRRPNFPFKD